MIADIYKCPKCGMNVYLAQDEDYCPLCAENDRDHMELVELGVDLEEDSNLDEPRYANFDHLLEVLQSRFGDDAANYAIDCWKYAWDATKTDLANADRLNAFLDNPNGAVTGEGVNPMTKEEMHAEIERIISLILSKCKLPRNPTERGGNLYSFEKKSPFFRLFIKKDLTCVYSDACFNHSLASAIYNYVPLEKGRPTPHKKDDYIVLEGALLTDLYYKKDFVNTAKDVADYVVYKYIAGWKSPWRLRWKQLFSEPRTYYIRRYEKDRI